MRTLCTGHNKTNEVVFRVRVCVPGLHVVSATGARRPTRLAGRGGLASGNRQAATGTVDAHILPSFLVLFRNCAGWLASRV